jgi:hypothetical protein
MSYDQQNNKEWDIRYPYASHDVTMVIVNIQEGIA